MLVPIIQHALRKASCSTFSWLVVTLITSCHCSAAADWHPCGAVLVLRVAHAPPPALAGPTRRVCLFSRVPEQQAHPFHKQTGDCPDASLSFPTLPPPASPAVGCSLVPPPPPLWAAQ